MKKRSVRTTSSKSSAPAATSAPSSGSAPTSSSSGGGFGFGFASAPPPPPPAQKEEPVTWASVDPRNNQTVDYAADLNDQIEAAYQAKKGTYDLFLGGAKFTIHFSEMVQKNQSGGQRRVIRRGPPPTFKAPEPFTKAEIESVLKIVAQVDKAVEDLEKNEENRSYKFKFDPGANGCNVQPIVDALERIIQGFKMSHFREKYGCGDDDSCLQLQLGQQVPSYYANVHDQSIYYRKMLSLCGLRNLVLHGPAVFEEMRAKLFSGASEDYHSREGPNKMRYFTGNAVDLDFVVLRCNDKTMLDAVNAGQKKHGLKTFKNGDELANSTEGKQMAINAASDLIDDFVKRFKLSASEIQTRHLNLDKSNLDIHVATGNTDRGKYPIWHYHNVGQSSYHVNVPSMPDIYGALLKAPYHLAKAMVLIWARFDPRSPEFTKAMTDFYDEAVADSCFNAKWKAIEEFCSTIEAKGTIRNLLDNIQMEHQAKFTTLMSDDPDRKKEEQLMVQLSQNLIGRDDSTGLTRKVTPEDVSAWIKATE